MLEARQKTTKATTARPKTGGDNNRCAKTMPTNRARFFTHWRGRMARKRASIFPPKGKGAGILVSVEYVACSCIDCFSCVKVVFSKNTVSLRHESKKKNRLCHH